MSFPVQVVAHKIICEMELRSHRMDLYWNVNTRLRNNQTLTRSHFLLNLSILLFLADINVSVLYLSFTLSLKALIIGGVRFLLQSHIHVYNLATGIK